MKELDFDELDKAVNSLMKGASKPAEVEAPDEPSEATTPSSPVSSSPVAIVSTPSEPAPTPSRGRFMDVVRPSVDMKSTTSSHPSSTSALRLATSSVSREGATITPKSSPLSQVDPIETPNNKPDDDNALLPQADEGEEWPDPLAFDQVLADERELSTATPTAVNEPSTQADEQVPLASPFLPNATVEKRPLGGTPTPTPPSTPLEPAPSSTLQANLEQTEQINPAPAPHPLSEEMGTELMAIESGSQIEEDVRTVSESAKSYTGPAATNEQLSQPRVSEPTNGAIYDTANYHQPLTHPAKKLPGWRIVAGIVVILVAGAGAGAGVYFLHLF